MGHAYLLLKWLHIVAAALLVGALLAMSAARNRRAEDPDSLLPDVLRLLDAAVVWLVVPALLVLFASGVFLSAGPLVDDPREGEEGLWIVAGMTLWALLATVAGGYVGGVVRRMRAVVAGDGGGGRAVDLPRLWRHFRWGVTLALLIAAVTVADMVFQPAG